METNEKMMTGEESLKIITEMINRTKVNITQGSFHLLLWGWLIFLCSLADYILMRFIGFEHSYYVWFLIIPGIFVSLIYGFTKGRQAKVHTYAEMIYMWTWIGFLGAFIALFFIQAKRMEMLASIFFYWQGLQLLLQDSLSNSDLLFLAGSVSGSLLLLSVLPGHQ